MLLASAMPSRRRPEAEGSPLRTMSSTRVAGSAPHKGWKTRCQLDLDTPVVRPDRSGRASAAAPDGRAAAQLPDQRAPLQDQQDCDAEWMKQGARPALPEPEHERYARAVDARAGHRGCRDRRPRAAAKRYKKCKERQDVPAAEQQGPDRERQRLRHAFGGILRKACQTSCPPRYIRQRARSIASNRSVRSPPAGRFAAA